MVSHLYHYSIMFSAWNITSYVDILNDFDLGPPTDVQVDFSILSFGNIDEVDMVRKIL